MKTITIENEDGAKIEFVGAVTDFSESIDTVTSTCIGGSTQVSRIGTGTVSITLRYVNGPIDAPVKSR